MTEQKLTRRKTTQFKNSHVISAAKKSSGCIIRHLRAGEDGVSICDVSTVTSFWFISQSNVPRVKMTSQIQTTRLPSDLVKSSQAGNDTLGGDVTRKEKS